MSQRVVVPMCPAMELSPNYSGDWRPRRREGRELRKAAYYCGLQCRPDKPLEGHVVLHARIGWGKRRQTMDRSNAAAALKWLVDGLQDAGWFANDKEVDILVVEQTSWGKLDKATRGIYPAGFITVDVVSMDAEEVTQA
jgi:hypothetical protein